jgi:hypothetical protein
VPERLELPQLQDYENGVTDIVVLEAENRVGGRINTIIIKSIV